ncbi:MAG: leucine-rich repeat protein [archaeon]|nr:leucine-rich repeat protein [archaeon]
MTYTLLGGEERTATASWDGSTANVIIKASVIKDGETYVVTNVDAFTPGGVLESVVIENNDMISFSMYQFVEQSNLSSVTLGEGIKVLPDGMFCACPNLSTITLPSSLTEIGTVAFGFSGLTTIVIPDNVTIIGRQAFNYCPLTSITFGTDSQLETLGQSAFASSGISSFDAPSGLRSIGDQAFMSCTALTNLTLSGSVTIGSESFRGCTALQSLTLSVKVIPANSFADCTGLKTVEINSETVGTAAFNGCSGLESVTFSNDLNDLSPDVFKGCSKLSQIILPDSLETLGTGIFQNCTSLTSVQLPNNAQVKSIPSEMFKGCTSLMGVDLSNMTEIGGSAFMGCTAMETLILPSTVTVVGEWAFRDCSSLSSVTIGENVESIGAGAFYATALKEIMIPAKLTSINFNVSYNALVFPLGIETINVSPENSVYASKDNLLYTKDMQTILFCPATITGELVIEANVGEFAFYKSALSKVTFANGVTSIGGNAFYQAEKLKEVVIANSVKTIGTSAFAKCSFEALILPAGISLGQNALPSSILYISFPDDVTGNAFISSQSMWGNAVKMYDSDGTTRIRDNELDKIAGQRFVWDGTTTKKLYKISDEQVLLTKVVSGVTSYGAIAKGIPFNTPEAPETPEGLTFIGWFTDSRMTVAHNEENDVNADLTLYAKFRIDICTVNLVVDNSVKDSISGLVPGSAITLPAETMDGQNFNGWAIGGTLLGAQYIVSVNDADDVGIITLEASFSPIERPSWALAVLGDVNGKAFWTATNAIGTYGMITVLPDEFETVKYTVSDNGGYGIISDNCAMVYSVDGNDVTVTVEFKDVGKASEYDVSVAEIASGEKHGFKATVTSKDGGYVDSAGKFAISYVYKTWNDTDKVWIYTTSGVTENVSNVTVTLPTDKKVPSVTGEFLLDNGDAILVFGFATFSFKGTSVTGTAEDVIVHSPVIMCVSEIQAMVGKP